MVITEVNENLINHDYFGEDNEEDIVYRYKLATEMNNNTYMNESEGSKRKRKTETCTTGHQKLAFKKNKTFKNDLIVKCKITYLQLVCACERKKMQTYCSCSPGMVRCKDCYQEHLLSEYSH